MAYEEQDFARALEIYKLTGRNLAETSRRSGMSRPTLYKAKKEGFPTVLTGGQKWDVYLDKQEEELVRQKKEELLEDERKWLETKRDQTDDVINEIYAKIVAGDVEVKPGDFDKLIRTRMLLDGVKQDKIEFMQAFAAKLLGIIADVVDEQQFTLVKSRVMGEMESRKNKLTGSEGL